MAFNFTLISSHIFPSKTRNPITDRYCSFSLVANKHEFDDLQRLSKQNCSINLSEILAVIVWKMTLNNGIHILHQWCHQSINAGTYQTALVYVVLMSIHSKYKIVWKICAKSFAGKIFYCLNLSVRILSYKFVYKWHCLMIWLTTLVSMSW